MNDEHTGQVTGRGFLLPEYLHGCLWLVTDSDTVPVAGPTGLFELTTPARSLTLHLGGETGAALAQFPWEPDALGWDGRVGVGGTVETVTVREINGVLVSVLGVVGRPLLRDASPYLLPSQRRDPDAVPPAFDEGVAPDVDEGFYTFLVSDESAFAPMAETALLNRTRVWLGGRVALDTEGWASAVALPLILQDLTLFAGI